jgi:membrane peptidoglycan carboxypeptidase
MELATVYATIAAGGLYCEPYLISRVESTQGQVLEEFKLEDQVRVGNENAVAELRKLLQVCGDTLAPHICQSCPDMKESPCCLIIL